MTESSPAAPTVEPASLDPGGEAYEAFHLEHRGIELIPDSNRPMRPSGLFWMWAGAIWNVEFLVYGALIVSFGLSFWQAVAAVLIGNLAYAFLGLASLPGPETGTTTFMVSRAPFGRNGNRVPSVFNWITQVGFEIEGTVLVVLIVQAMFRHEGVTLDDLGKVLVIVAAVAVQFVMPFLGHATITAVLRYLSFVFIAVFGIMACLVVPHAHVSTLHQHTSWWLWTTGLVLIVSAGGLGWTENGADYSRYLPRHASKARTFWAATLGAAIPSILLELLGATAYLVSPKVTAVTGVPSSFASWFFWPFLILAPAPALRHQHFGPVLVRCDPAGHRGPAVAVGMRGRRHRGVRSSDSARHLQRQLLHGLVGLLELHRGVAGALVRHLRRGLPVATGALRPRRPHLETRRRVLARRWVELAGTRVARPRDARRHDVGRRCLLRPGLHVAAVACHPRCRLQLDLRPPRGGVELSGPVGERRARRSARRPRRRGRQPPMTAGAGALVAR